MLQQRIVSPSSPESNTQLKQKVLFGPYGTVLDKRQRYIDENIADPFLINGVRRNFQQTVIAAIDYLTAGADVGTTNTYRLRKLLLEGERGQYEDLVGRHLEALENAIDGVRHLVKRQIPRLVAAGPYKLDETYVPTDLPRVYEAYELHRQQAEVAAKLGADGVIFETIVSQDEAHAAAAALQGLELTGYVNFAIGEHGHLRTGEWLSDAINEIDDLPGTAADGYFLNCAPEAWIVDALDSFNGEKGRIVGVYPNAFNGDPAELDGCGAEVGLNVGVKNREVCARTLVRLAQEHDLPLIGGCCGFEPEDIAAIAKARTVQYDGADVYELLKS